jgi:hypothetical protein
MDLSDGESRGRMPTAAAVEKKWPSPTRTVQKSSEKGAGFRKIHRAPSMDGAPRPSLWELARPSKSTPAQFDIARPRLQISVFKSLPKNHD